LKRTLRIEVIRYSRRSVVITDGSDLETRAETDSAVHELQIPSSGDVERLCNREFIGADGTPFESKAGLLSFLRQLIQGEKHSKSEDSST
jgi:hypothetical protein